MMSYEIIMTSSKIIYDFDGPPKSCQTGHQGALGSSRDVLGGKAGASLATPGSVPGLPGLLLAALGAPEDPLGMQNGPEIDENRASGIFA